MMRHRGVMPWHKNASLTLYPDERQSRGVLGIVRENRRVVIRLGSDIGEVVERLGKSRARCIGGHAQLLIELGEQLDGRFRPKAVFTIGETLLADRRARLTTLYGADPVDTYGTSEAGVVAWQCAAADLYHVNHEANLVEILDDDLNPVKPGELGHVVLTSLWNPLMPFVRYRVGDSAAWATRPCRCGSRLAALSTVAGRTYDWIVNSEGRRIAPHRMLISMHLETKITEEVLHYRVRQHEDRRVVVELVTTPLFERGHIEQLATSYRRLLGCERVDVRKVDRIDTAGSKFEVIRSDARVADESAR
jgi:phenylacetate-CoA ligase